MANINLRQEDALFSIGQTARLFNLNIRTLRYYDKIGLLSPEHVNEDTGYRYYSSQQFERLNTIKYLRALDVSIERIAEFLDCRDVELMRDIMAEQLESVQEKQTQLKRIEEKIARRIDQIDVATNSKLGEIEIVDMGQRTMMSLAESFSPTADLEPLIRDLSSRSGLNDAIFLGKVGVSVSLENLRARSFGRLSSVFVILEEGDGYQGTPEVIPAGCFARVRFRGTHRDASPHYANLLNFIVSSGLSPQGNSIEITLVDAGMTSDESQFVTEIQIPVCD